MAHRLNISNALKGRTIDASTRRLLSLKFKGRANTWARKRVECVETGARYESVTAGAREIGCSISGLSQAIRDGGRCRGNHYRFEQPRGFFDAKETGISAFARDAGEDQSI